MKRTLLILALLTSCVSLSQQDEQMTLYMQNPMYYNPAYAGSRNSLNFIALSRFQWVKFEGAPTSQWFSAHAPIMGGRVGVGGHFVNDQIGSRKRTAAYGNLSGIIRLGKKGQKLALGISGGADFMSFDFTNLNVNDPTDPYYTNRFTSIKPNVGAGIYYYSERHYLGISSPRVLEMQATDANAIVSSLNKRHFFLASGFVFNLNSMIQCKPSFMAKYTPNAPISIDTDLSFLFNEKFWIGAMYRYHESVGINAIFRIKNTFQVGYAYDFPINGLQNYQQGSHELLLTYDLNFKKHIFNSPRYF